MDKESNATSSWDYLDFDLEVHKGGPRDYPVAARSIEGGQAHEVLRFPFDKVELQNKLQELEIALLRSSGKHRDLSPEEQTIKDFGQRLFQSLFVGRVHSCYEASLREARRQEKGLRLRLHIQAPELAGLPWEFLYDSTQGEYLCLIGGISMVRYADLLQPVTRFRVRPPLKILGMAVSPRDLGDLDIAQEKHNVEEAIKDLRAKRLVELTWLPGQSSYDLQRAMRRGPWHVFHFIGHGDFDTGSNESRIAFAGVTGFKRLLKARDVGRLLYSSGQSLRLVLLNSCEGARGSSGDPFSSTAATLVRRGIPAVVAMQYKITDKAAIEFSRSFYDAVADGLPVDAAVSQARTTVSMESTLEWGTPVLYMRSLDGRIFDIEHIDALYNRCVRHFDAEEWQEALDCFEEVQRREPGGYRDSKELLLQAERKVEEDEDGGWAGAT